MPNVANIKEDFREADAELTERADNEKRVFVVTLSNHGDSPYLACVGDDGTTQIPARGDAHPDRDHLYVVNVRGSRLDDDSKICRVEVQYSSRTNFAGLNFQGGIDPGFITDPTNRAYTVEIGFTTIERVQQWDYSTPRKRIVNSAGEEFDPPRTRNIVVTTLVVERNEAVFNPNLPTIWNDVVNADDWVVQNNPQVIIAAGVAKVHAITARTFFESGIAGWRVRYEWHLFRDSDVEGTAIGWNPTPVLDQGYKTRASSTEKPRNALDPDTNVPYTAPVNLNGSGGVLTEGDPVYLNFNFFRTANYNGSAIDVL